MTSRRVLLSAAWPNDIDSIRSLFESEPTRPGKQNAKMRVPAPAGDRVALPSIPVPPRKIDAQSLSSVVRPDITDTIHQRVSAAQDHFNSENTKFKSVRNFRGGANAIFKIHSNDNKEYIAKPFSGAQRGHDPERWADRGSIAAKLFHHMGAGHMGVEGFVGRIPGENRMASGRILQPDSMDSEEKKRTMHATHADKPAYVTAYAKDTVDAGEAKPDELERVDAHHRLIGAVHHALIGATDGRHNNVLINTKHGHPVHIDHDMTLDSSHQRGFSNPSLHPDNPSGNPALMSIYGHGEDLDYRKGKLHDPATGKERELGDVGTNYPPHVHDTLTRAARGEFSNGLSDSDHRVLQNNANDLLTHGLEGTLARRYIVPTYKREAELAAMNKPNKVK